jgi:hypothetical protein
MTGELRLRLAALNRATYYLTAGLTDSGGLRDQASVTVVANCPPLDCPSSVTLQIPEDLPVGNVLGQIPPVKKILFSNSFTISLSRRTFGIEQVFRFAEK